MSIVTTDRELTCAAIAKGYIVLQLMKTLAADETEILMVARHG